MDNEKLAYSEPSFELQEFRMLNILGESTPKPSEPWELPEF